MLFFNPAQFSRFFASPMHYSLSKWQLKIKMSSLTLRACPASEFALSFNVVETTLTSCVIALLLLSFISAVPNAGFIQKGNGLINYGGLDHYSKISHFPISHWLDSAVFGPQKMQIFNKRIRINRNGSLFLDTYTMSFKNIQLKSNDRNFSSVKLRTVSYWKWSLVVHLVWVLCKISNTSFTVRKSQTIDWLWSAYSWNSSRMMIHAEMQQFTGPTLPREIAELLSMAEILDRNLSSREQAENVLPSNYP